MVSSLVAAGKKSVKTEFRKKKKDQGKEILKIGLHYVSWGNRQYPVTFSDPGY